MNFMKVVLEKHKTRRRRIRISEESRKVSVVLYRILYLEEMTIYLFKFSDKLEYVAVS